MQRWSLDAISLVSVALVALSVSTLPVPVAATLFCSELAFVAASVKRYRRFNRGAAPVNPNTEAASHTASTEEADGKHGSASGPGSPLRRLLDPHEGHVQLLRGGRASTLLSGWFLGAVSLRELGPQNLAHFVADVLLPGSSSSASGQPGLGKESSHQLAQVLAHALGLDLAPQEYNPNAYHLAPAKEPLRVSYRPLMFYMLTEAVAGISHYLLTHRHGFSKLRSTPVATYYIKKAPEGSPGATQPPLLFLHGIGLGLTPYLAFLDRLSSSTGRTIIAAQYKHVSMRLTRHVHSVPEVADDVMAQLDTLGIPKVMVVAHSYGTLVASTIVKRFAERLEGLTLLDPVCFAMFLPHLIRNTLYCHTIEEAGPWTWKRLLKGIVVRDLHCAAAMARNFDWSELNLWPSEIPANTTVVVGGADHMIPVHEICEVLRSSPSAASKVNLICQEGRGHGGFLMKMEQQEEVLAAIAGSAGAVTKTKTKAKAAHVPSAPAPAFDSWVVTSLDGVEDTVFGLPASVVQVYASTHQTLATPAYRSDAFDSLNWLYPSTGLDGIRQPGQLDLDQDLVQLDLGELVSDQLTHGDFRLDQLGLEELEEVLSGCVYPDSLYLAGATQGRELVPALAVAGGTAGPRRQGRANTSHDGKAKHSSHGTAWFRGGSLERLLLLGGSWGWSRNVHHLGLVRGAGRGKPVAVPRSARFARMVVAAEDVRKVPRGRSYWSLVPTTRLWG